MQELPLITTIATGFTVAWLLGLMAQWLRLSPIIGYLIAGVIIGPNTPALGITANVEIAQQLADMGVILLMFGVGLQFHIRDLIAVRYVAIPGATLQIILVTLSAAMVFYLFGVAFNQGVVMGMSMSVTSTVVLMRVLMSVNAMALPEGRIAVGWSILDDIFTVVLLVLIPVFAASTSNTSGAEVALWGPLFVAFSKLVILVIIVLWAGAYVVPRILVLVARLRSRELFTLSVLVFSVSVAAASYFFFGASMAMGAFLAGMVVAQSPVSNQAAADALPMRDAFAVLFFVSVGMLFEPGVLFEQPLMVLGALAVILLIKPLAALSVVLVSGYSLRAALTVALGIAQISEFSFILASLAWQHDLMTASGRDVIVAAAIISITINPIIFRQLPNIQHWLENKSWLAKRLHQRVARLATASGVDVSATSSPGAADQPRAMVVGYGPVGRTVLSVIEEAGIETLVMDLNMDTISALLKEGRTAVYGDASNPRVLEEAGLSRVTHLVVTIPDESQRAAIITAARSVNEHIQIVVRARYLREREELESNGVTAAVFEEAEAAIALARLVLADTGVQRDTARRKLEEIRFRLALETFPALRALQIRTLMSPWSCIQTLSSDLDRAEVLTLLEQHSHQVWPVLLPGQVKPSTYLRADEFMADTRQGEWGYLLREMHTVKPMDSVEDVFARLSRTGEPACLVGDSGFPLGMITRSELLNRVEGDFATGKTQFVPVTLAEAVARGGTIAAMEASTREEALLELAGAVPPVALPEGTDPQKIVELVFAREAEISTDLGNGIALPHARCEGLLAPIVVIGHSHEGIAYSEDSQDPVRLFFLVITAGDQPKTHLNLLSQIARLVGDTEKREALLSAHTLVEFLEVVSESARC